MLDVGAYGPGKHGDFEVAALAPEVLDGVAVADPDHVLVDDRPLVEVGRDVVGGDPDQLDAPLVRLVVRAGAAERRQNEWWMLIARPVQRSQNDAESTCM